MFLKIAKMRINFFLIYDNSATSVIFIFALYLIQQIFKKTDKLD